MQTKRVKLIVESCCGCGCDDVEVYREVPIESELKDGDRGGYIEDTDKLVEDNWEDREEGDVDYDWEEKEIEEEEEA